MLLMFSPNGPLIRLIAFIRQLLPKEKLFLISLLNSSILPSFDSCMTKKAFPRRGEGGEPQRDEGGIKRLAMILFYKKYLQICIFTS